MNITHFAHCTFPVEDEDGSRKECGAYAVARVSFRVRASSEDQEEGEYLCEEHLDLMEQVEYAARFGFRLPLFPV